MRIQKTFASEKAKLFVVSTPIGNLEDITIRALNTLKMVDYIYCEDTRVTIKLLNHYDIKTSLRSYHLFNENLIKSEIINLIEEGNNIAIVSDAGSPGISDPGWSVINKAIENDVDVVVIPGVSASLMALVGSGLPTERYIFNGFLPSKRGKKEEELKRLSVYEETIIIYEAPHRIKSTLEAIKQIMPQRQMVICRELTKRYEEYLRGTADEILKLDFQTRGEIVIIIEGNKDSDNHQNFDELTVNEHYEFYINQGFDHKLALKQVSLDRKMTKSDVYKELFVKK